jgi:hypothetical protein
MKISRLHAIIIIGTITMYSFSNVSLELNRFMKCEELKYDSVQYIGEPVSTEQLRIENALDKC